MDDNQSKTKLDFEFNMPIVRNKPEILLYNEKNEKFHLVIIKFFAKYHDPFQEWQDLSKMNNFPVGCVDLKLKKTELFL